MGGRYLELFSAFPSQKQSSIRFEEEYLNSSRSRVTNGQLPIIPQLGSTQDQYAPLGGGVWILGCLGGVYLLGKRKNRREE